MHAKKATKAEELNVFLITTTITQRTHVTMPDLSQQEMLGEPHRDSLADMPWATSDLF